MYYTDVTAPQKVWLINMKGRISKYFKIRVDYIVETTGSRRDNDNTRRSHGK